MILYNLGSDTGVKDIKSTLSAGTYTLDDFNSKLKAATRHTKTTPMGYMKYHLYITFTEIIITILYTNQ